MSFWLCTLEMLGKCSEYSKYLVPIIISMELLPGRSTCDKQGKSVQSTKLSDEWGDKDLRVERGEFWMLLDFWVYKWAKSTKFRFESFYARKFLLKYLKIHS